MIFQLLSTKYKQTFYSTEMKGVVHSYLDLWTKLTCHIPRCPSWEEMVKGLKSASVCTQLFASSIINTPQYTERQKRKECSWSQRNKTKKVVEKLTRLSQTSPVFCVNTFSKSVTSHTKTNTNTDVEHIFKVLRPKSLL